MRRKRSLKSVILLNIVACIVSCQSNHAEKMKEVIGQTLTSFPELIQITPETIHPNVFPGLLVESGAAVVFFFQKDECQTCIMEKVPDWADRISESISGVPIVFIFPTSAGKDLITLAKLTPNAYVMLDKENLFAKSNKFIPKESFLRVWLVDNNGKIILCGNPADNPKLADLYRREIDKRR